VRYYIFSLFVIGYMGLATPVQANKIISWVDDNGVTHFADLHPKSQTSVEEVHVQPTNLADVPTNTLSPSIHQAFAAREENKNSATRSDIVIKGPPKKVLRPAARPSTKGSNRRYRGSGRRR